MMWDLRKIADAVRDRSPGPLSNAYRADGGVLSEVLVELRVTNAKLDDVIKRLDLISENVGAIERNR